MSRLFDEPSENLIARDPAVLSPEFSIEQRRILLGIAHGAISSAIEWQNLNHQERSGVAGKDFLTGLDASASTDLAEPRGVFTTLYLNLNLEGGHRRELRGCVGYVVPTVPLYRAVAETARAAAFEDSRFSPVTEEEAPRLEVSLSVLSRLFSIEPGAVEIGRHGLVITEGSCRGLLLPQVPIEHGWDQETFLEQTCRKAGLPIDAWRKNATIQAFTAEVFADSDVISAG
jgi:AmmeMemoRadiSam system protein A